MKKAIAIFVDDNYINYAYTLINSLITNNKWFNDDIIILNNENCKLSEKKLQLLKSIYPNISIYVSDLFEKINDFDTLGIFNTNGRWKNVFIKLIVFTLKDQGYNSVLLLDADIIINKDISTIYNSCFDVPIEGYLDENYFNGDRETFFEIIKTEFIDKNCMYGLNAGFININLDYFSYDIFNDIIEWVYNGDKQFLTSNREFGYFPEQDVLNGYFKYKKFAIKYYNYLVCSNNSHHICDDIYEKCMLLHLIFKPSFDWVKSFDEEFCKYPLFHKKIASIFNTYCLTPFVEIQDANSILNKYNELSTYQNLDKVVFILVTEKNINTYAIANYYINIGFNDVYLIYTISVSNHEKETENIHCIDLSLSFSDKDIPRIKDNIFCRIQDKYDWLFFVENDSKLVMPQDMILDKYLELFGSSFSIKIPIKYVFENDNKYKPISTIDCYHGKNFSDNIKISTNIHEDYTIYGVPMSEKHIDNLLNMIYDDKLPYVEKYEQDTADELYNTNMKVAICCIYDSVPSYLDSFIEYYKNAHYVDAVIICDTHYEGMGVEDYARKHLTDMNVKTYYERLADYKKENAYNKVIRKYGKEYNNIIFIDINDRIKSDRENIEDIRSLIIEYTTMYKITFISRLFKGQPKDMISDINCMMLCIDDNSRWYNIENNNNNKVDGGDIINLMNRMPNDKLWIEVDNDVTTEDFKKYYNDVDDFKNNWNKITCPTGLKNGLRLSNYLDNRKVTDTTIEELGLNDKIKMFATNVDRFDMSNIKDYRICILSDNDDCFYRRTYKLKSKYDDIIGKLNTELATILKLHDNMDYINNLEIVGIVNCCHDGTAYNDVINCPKGYVKSDNIDVYMNGFLDYYSRLGMQHYLYANFITKCQELLGIDDMNIICNDNIGIHGTIVMQNENMKDFINTTYDVFSYMLDTYGDKLYDNQYWDNGISTFNSHGAYKGHYCIEELYIYWISIYINAKSLQLCKLNHIS